MTPNVQAIPHGVMEGKGAYNRHAMVPAGGAVLALPHLEKAVRSIELDTGDQPIIVVDYGSSQGKNSLIPMQTAIKGLRQRVGSTRPIFVYHVDQPSNDFNTLFGVLDGDPDTYVLNDPNLFPAAVGRSFYQGVLPPASVHLGWSSYAAVWLSRIPKMIPGHFIAARSTGAVREEFERQAAKDWEAFLSLRARELRRGGQLVVVLPALAEDGSSGIQNLMDQANAVLEEMVADGSITSKERARMVVGSYPRRKRELLAPFAPDGRFHDLSMEKIEISELPDPAWAEYEREGNKQALAMRQALFFRAIFMPSLASALDRVRSGDAEALRIFGDRMEVGLKLRLGSQPTPMHSLVQTVVLAKGA